MTYTIRGKTYNIENIIKSRCTSETQRQNLLYTIVKQNPGIIHQHILKIVASFDGMAKRTAEKQLKNMDEMKIFHITKKSYLGKMYEIMPEKNSIELKSKKNLDKLVRTLNSRFKKLKTNYDKLNIFEQALSLSLFLTILYNFKPYFELVSKLTDFSPIKEHTNTIEELIKKTYQLMNKSHDPFLVLMSIGKDLDDKIENLNDELEKLLDVKNTT